MDGLDRRKTLTAGGAIGASGAASPAGARALWTWSPESSIAGAGGIDRPLVNAPARFPVGTRVADMDGIPEEPFREKVITAVRPKLIAFGEKLIPLPLVPPLAWTIDEEARQYILFHLAEGQGSHIEIPESNRPGG